MAKSKVNPLLSDDAKCAASLFSMGGLAFALSFQMQEARPSIQLHRALNELMAAEMITCHGKAGGGCEYKPIAGVDFVPYRAWVNQHPNHPLPMTEPTKPG